MPGATRRTAATRSSPPPTWRCGCKARRPRLCGQPGEGSTAAAPNNVVPDLAVLRVNLRPATLDDQARAQRLIDTPSPRSPPSTTSRSSVHGRFGRPPKPMTPEREALFDLVKRPAPTLASRSAGKPTGGVCDGNNIAACGVPVIDTMGVRGGSDPFDGGISDRRQPGRARGAVGADHPAPGRRAA